MMKPRGWRWPRLTAVAALGGFGAWVLVLSSELREAGLALEESTAYVAQMSGELAATRRDADLLVDALGVLRADDLVHIDLFGQAQAPGATGRLFASRRGVLFHAQQLPVLDAGRVYQLWLRAGAAKPMNVGRLEVSAFGTATLNGLLPAGVSGVTAATVTDEPVAGSPEPTTPPVLGGERR
jgi:hypothetical protein